MTATSSSASAPPSRVAPPAPSFVSVETRSDGVVVLTLEDASSAHNTITPAFAAALDGAITLAFGDAKTRAVVVRSGKKDSFVVGANLELVRAIRFSQDAEDAAREIASHFARLGTGPKPVVAYVHGAALGGGFELALACTASVATDDAKTVLGLPEVKLGLVPAANGLFRVADRAGLRAALELGLSGKSLRAQEALRLGLVDDVVPVAIGLETAIALARRLADDPTLAGSMARDRGQLGGLKRLERALVEGNPIGRRLLIARARRKLLAKTRGHLPAAERLVDLLARFGARGFRAAAEATPRVFGDLVVSETAHRMIDLFFAQSALKKELGVEASEITAGRAVPAVERLGVIGAGPIGSAIACMSAEAGIAVRVKDEDDAAIGRGLWHIARVLDERVRRGSMSTRERAVVFARVTGATDNSGLRRSDVVIESVFEDLELKRAVVRELETIVSDACIIASNTSAIPITRIAEQSARPDRIVGMHYFSPAHRTLLLEVVRTELTGARAVATAVGLGKQQGKTVIVVHDGPGFYTTRILVPYLNEAVHLLSEGASIDSIDEALIEWGFPVGPFELMDELGLALGARVAAITHAAFGERMRPPAIFAALHADAREGKANAHGFYLHGTAAPRRSVLHRGRRAKRVDPTIYGLLGLAPHAEATTADEIALRCGLAIVNEAVRSYGEGIVRSARDGDIGAVVGAGFPAFRGGPLRYVDVLGAVEVLRRLRSLEQRFGERFEPAPLLVEMARGGRRFYA